MEYNLKMQVNMGLQKDWGVFNLYGAGEGNAYEKIEIEVMTDGDSYVENTATSVAHAASSPYKELDAIQPLLTLSDGTVGWEITKYGSNFKKMMNGYYPIEMSTEGGDLWSLASSYKDYINQFKIVFEEEVSPYSDTGGQQYYDYKANVKPYEGRHYIKKTFAEISNDNYIYANIDLIHFSKYYNIYSPSTVPIPALRPLIYDEDMLNDLGISLDEETGKPHINNLILMDIESDDSEETINMKHCVYNGSGYDYEEGPQVSFTRGVHNGMSMFKSCPQPDAEYFYLSDEDEFYQFMPEGFSLLALWGRTPVFNGDNKTHSSAYDGKTLPASYTKYFLLSYNTYSVRVIDDSDNHYPLLTLVYFGDQKQNIRIFNNYFPVTKSGHTVTDTIAYKSSYLNKMVPTISMALVSVLANIYIYNGESSATNDITYISDCVFLAQNSTLYTKDIVFKAYVADPGDKSDVEKTEYYLKMLLFQKIPFDLYVNAVKTAALKDTSIDSTYTALDLNVSPDINACIKNIPLLLNINYAEPNIEAVGLVGNQTRVFKIDSKPKDVFNWTPETNKLYQLTLREDGEYHIDSLKEDFVINYLKEGSLSFEDHKVKGVFDESLALEVNPYLCDVFKYDADGLGFMATKANGQTKNYYSMSTREYHGGVFDSYYTYATLKFIPKNDVLIPFAKMM